MSYVSYGLLTGVRDFAKFPDANLCANELLATAIIEANKELGDSGSKSPDSIMIEGFNRYKELIHQQLDACSPDLIIVCLPESLRCVVNSLYSHFYACDFQNGLGNVYVDGADVGISQGQKPLFLWPYHPQASKGYLGKGITDYSYTMSLLKAYDKVLEKST